MVEFFHLSDSLIKGDRKRRKRTLSEYSRSPRGCHNSDFEEKINLKIPTFLSARKKRPDDFSQNPRKSLTLELLNSKSRLSRNIVGSSQKTFKKDILFEKPILLDSKKKGSFFSFKKLASVKKDLDFDLNQEKRKSRLQKNIMETVPGGFGKYFPPTLGLKRSESRKLLADHNLQWTNTNLLRINRGGKEGPVSKTPDFLAFREDLFKSSHRNLGLATKLETKSKLSSLGTCFRPSSASINSLGLQTRSKGLYSSTGKW